MHVNETELPLTVTRRRVTSSAVDVNPNVDHSSPKNVDKSKARPFSSFANFSASLWSSAQVCKMFYTCFFHTFIMQFFLDTVETLWHSLLSNVYWSCKYEGSSKHCIYVFLWDFLYNLGKPWLTRIGFVNSSVAQRRPMISGVRVAFLHWNTLYYMYKKMFWH